MLVSLVAVVAGPVVTFKIAKRQIVSPIRQKWIDELREIISEYLSQCEQLLVFGEDALLNTNGIDNEKQKIYTRLLYLEQKLKLMLNPKEQEHNDLLNIISIITDEINHGVSNIIIFGNNIKSATTISQKILKIEWQRVKNGAI